MHITSQHRNTADNRHTAGQNKTTRRLDDRDGDRTLVRQSVITHSSQPAHLPTISQRECTESPTISSTPRTTGSASPGQEELRTVGSGRRPRRRRWHPSPGGAARRWRPSRWRGRRRRHCRPGRRRLRRADGGPAARRADAPPAPVGDTM